MERITRNYIHECYAHIKDKLELREYEPLEPLFMHSMSYLFDYTESLEAKIKALQDTLDISHQLNDELREENKGLLKACDSFNAENKELEAQLASKGKVVAEFSGKAYDGTFYKGRSKTLQSENQEDKEANVEFVLEDTYGILEKGKRYTVTITEG